MDWLEGLWLKNFICHKAGLYVMKHEWHVIKHVLHVMKQKKKKAVKNYEMRNLLWKYFPENIFCVDNFSETNRSINCSYGRLWIYWKAYDLKIVTRHKACFTCHEATKRKFFKIMKCEILYKIIFVKRTFFIILIFPKQTGL